MKAPLINPDYNPLRLDYWFGEVDSRPVAIFRILFALQLLKDAVYHLALGPLFYSDEGIFPLSALREVARSNRFSIMDALDAPWMVTTFFLVWVVVLLNLLVGNRARLMAVLNFLIILSVHERNIYLLNGGDTVMRVMSFWLIFLPLAQVYSVDALRRRRQRYLETGSVDALRRPAEPIGWAFPLRVAQLQIALVYIFATLTKLPGDAWLNGEALYYALQIDPILLGTGHLLFDLSPPWLLRLLTWGALLTEGTWVVWVFLPFFQPLLRRIGLVLGVLFHLGIALTMAIPNFSIVMIITYVLFLDGELIGRVERWLRAARQPARVGIPPAESALWWAIAAADESNLAIDTTLSPGEVQMADSKLTGDEGLIYALGYGFASRLWIWLLRIEPVKRVVLSALEHRFRKPDAGAAAPTVESLLRKRVGRVLTLAVVTPVLILVTWWNLASLDFAGDRRAAPPVRGVPRAVVQYSGMWQSWKLFAPFPSRTYGWVAVPGVFENGETFDLRTGLPEGEEYARWVFGPFNRWRKYEDRIRSDNAEDLLRAWGSYYCQVYNERIDLPEGERLATMEIHYYWRRTPDPGDPPNTYTNRMLWKHWCFPEYAY